MGNRGTVKPSGAEVLPSLEEGTSGYKKPDRLILKVRLSLALLLIMETLTSAPRAAGHTASPSTGTCTHAGLPLHP